MPDIRAALTKVDQDMCEDAGRAAGYSDGKVVQLLSNDHKVEQLVSDEARHDDQMKVVKLLSDDLRRAIDSACHAQHEMWVEHSLARRLGRRADHHYARKYADE